MNAEPLCLATTTQRDQYADWAERIAAQAKRGIVADKFRSYADAARNDGSFYASTPEFNAAHRG